MARWCALLLVLAGLVAADPYRQEAGPGEPASMDFTWRDAARGRDVPVRIWYPKDGAGPFPIILFSHGLGGTREGYAIWGKHWASWGYVVCNVQHLGSDDAVWRGVADPMAAMRRAAADPRNAINRPRDISFAIDQMIALNDQDGPLKGRLDTKKIGMSGHSFGGYTTLAASGLVFPLGQRDLSLGDPRITASIAMSAPAVGKNPALYDKAYGGIKIPMLHLTGTEDNSPIGDTTAAQRRVPYDHIKAPDQILVVYQGGDHMVFSGMRRAGDGRRDDRIHNLIRQCTTAFWDTWLKGDAQAKDWLYGTGYKTEMGGDGTFETK